MTQYNLQFSCGCTATCSFPLRKGAGRMCDIHQKFVTITDCEPVSPTLAKYYSIAYSCGCCTTSSSEVAVGSPAWCHTHQKEVTVASCYEHTTM